PADRAEEALKLLIGLAEDNRV
ncbi:ribonuclease H family protein, partial [Mesorhizobium sp. M7A.F.Ca.US.003.02.2.1]